MVYGMVRSVVDVLHWLALLARIGANKAAHKPPVKKILEKYYAKFRGGSCSSDAAAEL